MINLYPIMLRLRGRNCVVVGGGEVGVRKALGLVNAGAHIVIISPELHPMLEKLANGGAIEIQKKSYTTGTLTKLNPFLVFAATNDSYINQQIADEARQLGALANIATESEEGDFMNMAIVRRGAITIAVSSEGTSPALAKYLQKQIEIALGNEYATLTKWMGESRLFIQDAVSDQRERAQFWRMVINSNILALLQQGDEPRAHALFDKFTSGVSKKKL